MTSHPGERAQAQHIAEQLLAGSDPGAIASWGMGHPHSGSGPNGHPYGEHTYAAYVRGDGSVYSTMFPPS